LVVDAGATFGLSLHRSLREYGYDVRLATSAGHALRNIHARHFDFMVVHDEGEGRARAALVAVRGVVPSLPCAVIGGEGNVEGEREIIAHAGPVTVFGKPLDLMQLISAIERALKAGPPANLVCEVAASEQPTRRDLPAAQDEAPPIALADTSRSLAVLDDPPHHPLAIERARRPTVKVRALDAGVYSIQNGGRDVIDRLDAY
jgi:ActR/RegA family two-component response regulator